MRIVSTQQDQTRSRKGQNHFKILLYALVCLVNTAILLFGTWLLPATETLPLQSAATTAQTIPTPTATAEPAAQSTTRYTLFMPLMLHEYSNRALTSPDGELRLQITVAAAAGNGADGAATGNQLHYSLHYRGKSILQPSALGLHFDAATPPLSDLQIERLIFQRGDAWYATPLGEQSQLRDYYNEMQVYLRERGGQQRPLQVTLRAYNQGIALRYTLPAVPAWEGATIVGEATEFAFGGNHLAYLQEGTEGSYQPTLLSAMQGKNENPLTLAQRDGLFTSISEAHVENYPRMMLTRHANISQTVTVALAGAAGGELPRQSPWRVLLVADSAAALLQGKSLFTNLSPPNRLADISWIQPGQAMRIGTLTTAAAHQVIDFAATHGIEYVEFDAGWYPNGYWAEFDPASDATRAIAEIDLPTVLAHAKAKGVGMILYVNRVALRQQIDTILPLYAAWGIRGIKFGFEDGRTQAGINFLHRAVERAATHRLFIDIHDSYRPSGMSRTYPNLLTQEGMRGNEHFSGATHNTILPFTRLLAGAGDYTFPYYHKRLNVTRAHQLAAMIVFFSPLQFVFWYDSPVDYNGEAEVALIGALPTTWDETIVVDGQIGEQITVARRSGSRWFVGTLTNATAREVDLPLTFLPPGQRYRARLYWDQDVQAVGQTTLTVTSESVIGASLLPSGGHLLWLEPIQ